MTPKPTTEEKLREQIFNDIEKIMFFPPNLTIKQKAAGTEVITNYILDKLSLQATQERDRVIEEVKSEIWMDYTIIIQSSPHNIEVCGFCSNTGRIKNPDANGKPCICPNGYQLKEEK